MTQQHNRPKLLDRYFGFVERRGVSDRLIWHGVLIAVVASLLWFIVLLNNTYVTAVPTPGGTLVEGVVGTPRFVNPVLAITRADHDMAALVYSGLVKLNEAGELVPDVAEKITISEDRRTYNIKLREDISFHNGTPLTVKDVVYTIALIQNPDLKSPLQGNWSGVLVEELGDYEMNIVLEEPYTPFIENLRVGILPRDLWDDLPTEQMPFSQNNTEPIGSGPYHIVDALRTESGLIRAYRLEAFDHTSNISTLVFNFYQNEEDLLDALADGDIAGTASLSQHNAATLEPGDFKVVERPLPRTFAVYFNQNKSIVLRDDAVREALDSMIDRADLIDTVLRGFGSPIESPVPPDFVALTEPDTPDGAVDRVTKASSILRDGGWTRTTDGAWVKNAGEDSEITLSLDISSPNTELFDATANYVAERWRELGVAVTVSEYEQADLVQAIIRPRNFEALLFGAEVGRSVDLYPFWHSSQKDDPGLNIAQYTNIDVDALLEDTRVATSTAEKTAAIDQVVRNITSDIPAVFLFSPTFRYFLDPAVEMQPISKMSSQSDRFANISNWHITQNRVWPIFSNN